MWWGRQRWHRYLVYGDFDTLPLYLTFETNHLEFLIGNKIRLVSFFTVGNWEMIEIGITCSELFSVKSIESDMTNYTVKKICKWVWNGFIETLVLILAWPGSSAYMLTNPYFPAYDANQLSTCWCHHCLWHRLCASKFELNQCMFKTSLHLLQTWLAHMSSFLSLHSWLLDRSRVSSQYITRPWLPNCRKPKDISYNLYR